MITPEWVRMMAAYNAEMNRRVYAAAGRLDDAERRRERGAFFGSIHGTLNHLVWGDRAWMARFAGWEPPPGRIPQSVAMYEGFADLAAARAETDARLSAWAQGLEAGSLEGNLTWFSGAAGREVSRPRPLLVTHMFNHQTHHRGQVHAMLTAAGEHTGDTDIFLVVEEQSGLRPA